ncbi:SERTA domain-containing protein 3 [Paramarasmius palmivorus]|uniref:SERTA domain-containing protein 3 n=1 Tax=Paramarasmius palmivorus TaxID=297713 RepID=A0AAW0B176_9AGAR
MVRGLQHGARLAYLESKLPGYFIAVKEGYGPEYLAQVEAGFFRRFHPSKGDAHEPSAEELAKVEDDGEDDEILVEPFRKENESLEDFQKRMDDFRSLKDVVAAKIAQIDRWMRYRYRKQQEVNLKESDAFQKLLTKLTGMDSGPGRRRPAYVEWARANPELVDELVRAQMNAKREVPDGDSIRAAAIREAFTNRPKSERQDWEKKALDDFRESCSKGVLAARLPGYLLWAHRHATEVDQHVQVALAAQERQKAQEFAKKGPDAYVAVRQDVVKRAFGDLPEDQKNHWVDVSKKNHEGRIEKYEKEKAAGFSMAPEARQQAIDRITTFLTPILEGLNEATGWNFSLFGGGPEPIDAGRLNTVAMHIGKTAGPVPMTFGAMFRPQIKKNFNGMFGVFLKKCFSTSCLLGVAECQSRAIQDPHLQRPDDVLEDLTYTVVRERLEDQGERGDSPSDPLPSSSSVSIQPSRQHTQPSTSSTKSSASMMAGAKQVVPVKPIQADRTLASKAFSGPGSHARIRPPMGPPRAPLQGAVAPSSSSSLPTSTSVSSNTKGKKPSAVTSQKPRAPSPISVPSSPQSSPSMPPASLLPASPISVRSSPEPDHSGHASSPIDLVSSPAPTPSRTYKSRPRVSSPTKARVTTKASSSSRRVTSTFVGVVIPVKPHITEEEVAKDSDDDTPLVQISDDEKSDVDDLRETVMGKGKASAASGASSNAVSAPAPSIPKKRRLAGGSKPSDQTLGEPEPSASAPGPRTKRRKTETAISNTLVDPVPEHVPHMVSTPSSAPSYVQSVLSIVHEAQMDRQLCDVVMNWLRLDKNANYTGGRLLATDRLTDVGDWIARGCPVGYKRKHMKDLGKFGDAFEQWYKNCAPAWRKDEGRGIRLTRRSGEDWSPLAIFGANGIVSFVVALAWWKMEVKNMPCRTPRERQDKLVKFAMYEGALDEIEYTFRCLREAGY